MSDSQGSIIGAVSFERLEQEFVEAIGTLPCPLPHSWVLVPTNLVALHLRRACASRVGGILDLNFYTLKDAARELARGELARKGLRPAPPGCDELVVREALRQCPAGSYFAGLQDAPNLPFAVLRAIRLLENCLWSPQKLRSACGGLRSADAAGKLEELARVWEALRQWKQERCLFDTEDLILEASQIRQVPWMDRPPLLFLYGFYDFTPLQQAFVRRVAGLCRFVAAFLLWAENNSGHPSGFEYARAALDFVKDLAGTDRVLCVDESECRTDLDRIRKEAFREHPFLSEEEARRRAGECEGAFDGTVRFVSCAGEFPEALEAVREALCAFQSEPEMDSTGVGVLLRTAEGSAELFKEAFERAGIRCYLREGLPLRNTVPGRILLSLLFLASGEPARDEVVEFLSLARIEWPEGLSATAVDGVSRAAGIARGRQQWANRLRERAGSLSWQAQQAESSAEKNALLHEAELCQSCAGFVGEFFEEVSQVAACRSWPGFAQTLTSLLEKYAPEGAPGREEVLELVEGLASLELTGSAPDIAKAGWLVGRWLAQKSLHTDAFQRGGVTISTIMGCRGVTYDVLIIPGLCEKVFPSTVRSDPILDEADREGLNRQAQRLEAGPLPLQALRSLEEQYLFRIALASARKRLVLCYPRIEQHSGRDKMPSRFLLGCCGALLGFNVSSHFLEEGFFPRSLLRRAKAPTSGSAHQGPEVAVDLREYDLRAFLGTPQRPLRAGYTRAISDCFGRTLLMEKLRWGSRDFGPFDGKVRCQHLVDRLRQKAGGVASPVSPTQFETYARCPFRYFLRYVLEIQEIAKPVEEFALGPADRGRVIHNLMRRVYEANLKGKPFKEIQQTELKRIAEYAARIADEVAEGYPQSMPAPWAAEREDALESLDAAIQLEMGCHPQAMPWRFELEFGREGGQPPLALAVAPDTTVSFMGRIDRVDLVGDEGVQVVDYKTGKSTGCRAKSFQGGTQLQLPIYLLAAAAITNAPEGSALYLFLSEGKALPQFTSCELEQRMDDLRTLLKLIVYGIRQGDFFPLPVARESQFCKDYCEFRLVCGMGRARIASTKSSDPALRGLRRLREID